MFYLLTIMLFLVGLFCILTRRNLIKVVIGLLITEQAANLFFILVGYRTDGLAPIRFAGMSAAPIVDPLPQAMVLTSIVIGLGTLSLLITLVMRVYQNQKTLDESKVNQMRG